MKPERAAFPRAIAATGEPPFQLPSAESPNGDPFAVALAQLITASAEQFE